MGDSSADRTHTIVLAIDGLRASALGAYGATSHSTPALDEFAAQSTLHEWAYAPAPDLETLYARLGDYLPIAAANSLLVSDTDAAPPGAFAERFDAKVSLDIAQPTDPAASIRDTSQAAVWGGFAEALAEAASTTAEDGPLFAWLHANGMYGAWDAPPESYESLVDEEDPAVEPSATPAEASFDGAGSEAACEARFAAACRYAGQVATLDACFGGWLDVVDGLLEGEALRVVLLGLRGYPLGEHGRIGGVDPRLFSEQQHVPFIVRTGNPADRFARVDRPMLVGDALRGLLTGVATTETKPVVMRSTAAEALLSRDRMLRRPIADEASPELYVKPDDRWEQNDIASLEESVVDEMLANLAGRESSLASQENAADSA